jgi:ATP-binding cassette subfamily A (ABC1) protein 3
MDPSNPKQNLVNAAIIVEWVLRFIPAFNLSKGLFNILYLEAFEFMEGKEITVWHDSVLLYEVIFLAWQSVVYLLLAMQLDQWSSNPRAVSIWRGFVKIVTFQFLCPSSHGNSFDFTIAVPEDDDVLAEQECVLTGRANDDLVVFSELTKVYDNGKLAVNNVSLGIPPGECFGLLGINGTGRLAEQVCVVFYWN